MSRGLNKIMLIGNVGQEPDIRATSSGSRVAKVSLATNRQYQDRQGNTVDDTQWHRLTFFGKLADIVEQWVNKGDRLYVEGRVEYSQTEGDDGNTRYWTDVVVNEMVMLGGNGDAPAGRSGSNRDSRGGTNRDRPLTEPDDDLPF